MSPTRKIVFATNYIYHIFNRGVDKRLICNSARDYTRLCNLFAYYGNANAKLSFSKFIKLSKEQKEDFIKKQDPLKRHVDILAYCIMPNHFHILVKQTKDYGISKFMANISNGYTRYFNLKNERTGSLFGGRFKAVHVGHNEQLMQVSKYIHLNPVEASLTTKANAKTYKWSSLKNYTSCHADFVKPDLVLGNFKTSREYIKFIEA